MVNTEFNAVLETEHFDDSLNEIDYLDDSLNEKDYLISLKKMGVVAIGSIFTIMGAAKK